MARARRRRVSLTSLIDVIFLLLLFFMLTSTFSKFAEVDLTASGGSAAPTQSDVPPLFLRLSSDDISLNGRSFDLQNVIPAINALGETEGRVMLISLRADVSAQRLTDLLVVLRAVPGMNVSVLGAG